MATELAAGYVSLSVRLAKDATKDITKEVKKAGTEGGKSYSDEFTKEVAKDVGKKLPDTISKSTKRSGGWRQGAKEAADEFGKGFREGVEEALGKAGAGAAAADEFTKGLRDGIKKGIEEHGGVAASLDVMSNKIKDVTGIVGNLGDAFGIEMAGIESKSATVTKAIDGISDSVSSTQTALEQFKSGDVAGGLQSTVDALKGLQSVGLPEGTVSAAQRVADGAANARTQIDGVIGPLEQLTELAGPDSKLYAAGKKLPLVGDLLEFGIAANRAGHEAEDFIKKSTGLTVPLSGESFVRQLTDDFNAFNSAADNAQAKLDAARATASGPIPSRAHNPAVPHGGGRAGGGGITGPGGPKSDIIPIWASAGEHVLSAADVAKMGGQAGVYAFRNMLKGFSVGGAIDFAASVGDGRPYLYGGVGPRYDCSGYMSAIYAAMTGKPQGTRYFTTESDFKSLGFLPGSMPGAFNIGIRRGGGGRSSHMAGTLPDGTHVESGGSHGSTLFGSGAAGAEGFPLKFYLPVSGGDPGGMTGGGGGAGRAGGGSGGGSGGGGGYTGYGPSGTNETGSNPYAKLAALEKQKQDAIAQIFGPSEIGTLADIGVSGLKETLLPPETFSDPTQWKSTKSVAGLLQAIGTLSGNPQMSSIMGGIGGLMTGQGSAVTGFIPEPFGTMPMPQQPQPSVPGFPGQAGGPGGTGGITIGQYNDQSGKGLQDATRLGAFENSPATKHLSRIR